MISAALSMYVTGRTEPRVTKMPTTCSVSGTGARVGRVVCGDQLQHGADVQVPLAGRDLVDGDLLRGVLAGHAAGQQLRDVDRPPEAAVKRDDHGA